MLYLNKIGNIRMNKKKDFDKEFEKLAKQEKMPISSVEDLMLKDLENYKNELLTHTEELLLKKIDEKDLITKKRFLE